MSGRHIHDFKNVSAVLQVASPPPKPLLVFDGDCNFCRRWIRRWRKTTGELVDYLPFQDPQVGKRFPEVPRECFEQAVQLIEADGRVYAGAEAVLRTLACSKRWPLWVYRKAPGARFVAEHAYRFVAKHRGSFSKLS